jgi:hypothetical protein
MVHPCTITIYKYVYVGIISRLFFVDVFCGPEDEQDDAGIGSEADARVFIAEGISQLRCLQIRSCTSG